MSQSYWKEKQYEEERRQFDYVKRNIIAQHQANVKDWKLWQSHLGRPVARQEILVPVRWGQFLAEEFKERYNVRVVE